MAMAMDGKRIIVMPSDFTIDDVTALYCFLQAHKCSLNDVNVRFYTHEMLGHSFGDNTYLIDCGPNDYKERNMSCATAVVCADFAVEADDVLGKLIEVLTRNNQNGFLRQHIFSLPFAIRYSSQIGRDREIVLREGLEVIDTYLHLKRTKKFNVEEAKEKILRSKTLKAVNDQMHLFLSEYGGKNMEYHIFTLPWYIAARIILGDKISDIRDCARFWFRMFLAIEKKRKEAEEDLKNQRCFVKVGDNYWFVAETDNPFFAGIVFRYNCAVAIIKNPKTGNVAILTARNINMGFDMSQVGRILNQREKGIWYYNNRIQAVLNGSVRRPQPPTKLLITEIFKIVKENII